MGPEEAVRWVPVEPEAEVTQTKCVDSGREGVPGWHYIGQQPEQEVWEVQEVQEKEPVQEEQQR